MAENQESEPVKDLEGLRQRYMADLTKVNAVEVDLSELADALKAMRDAQRVAVNIMTDLGLEVKEEMRRDGAIENLVSGLLYEVTNQRDMKQLEKSGYVWVKAQLEGQKGS